SIWLTTFLILPPLLTPRLIARRVAAGAGSPSRRVPTRFVFRVSCFVFLAATAYLTLRALTIQLNTNPRSLDGSPASLRSDESNFAKVWGDPRNHALLLVSRPTPPETPNPLHP